MDFFAAAGQMVNRSKHAPGASGRQSYNFNSHFAQEFMDLGHGGTLIQFRASLVMSITIAENFIRNAREQHSQQDINSSVLKALAELTRELKRLDDEVRRVRRDVQMSRRF
jgi:hypothetical protein